MKITIATALFNPHFLAHTISSCSLVGLQYYDHPAIPNLFSNFTQWFSYLKGKGLRTYFNVSLSAIAFYPLRLHWSLTRTLGRLIAGSSVPSCVARCGRSPDEPRRSGFPMEWAERVDGSWTHLLGTSCLCSSLSVDGVPDLNTDIAPSRLPSISCGLQWFDHK